MKTYHDDLPRSLLMHAAIKESLQQHNTLISFADFMELALYHPQYGYYQQPDFSIGKTGDFTTAPEISPLFAYCFARQCQQIRADYILELGAGTGRFALDLLSRLDSLQMLPKRYYIYEISHHLRQTQQNLIQSARPDFMPRIEWLSELPKQFSGVMIANELLDAIPFERFQIENQQAKQCMVALHEDQFIWRLAEPRTTELSAALADIQNHYHLS